MGRLMNSIYILILVLSNLKEANTMPAVNTLDNVVVNGLKNTEELHHYTPTSNLNLFLL